MGRSCPRYDSLDLNFVTCAHNEISALPSLRSIGKKIKYRSTVLQQNPDGKGEELGLGEELWETSSSPGSSKISFMKDKRNEAGKSLTRTDLTEV